MLLNDPFNRSQLPVDAMSREARIAMIGEVFEALRDGKPLSRAAAAFVGGAGMAWLEQGGDLARDYWKITLRHSHNNPQAVWQRLKRASIVINDEGVTR